MKLRNAKSQNLPSNVLVYFNSQTLTRSMSASPLSHLFSLINFCNACLYNIIDISSKYLLQ